MPNRVFKVFEGGADGGHRATYISESAASDSGGGGGMDGWQNSVEKRLDSLDRRLMAIEGDASTIKTDLATVKANVAHLPSKGFIVTIVLTALTAITLLVGIVTNLDRLLPNGSTASDARQSGAAPDSN